MTYLAIDLIRKRMRHTYGDEIEQAYEVHGIPADLDGARALFEENPFDFERWVVSLIDAQPNEKQVGDRGPDGVTWFHADETHIGRVLVSVKGGRQLAPTMVRDLVGTVQRETAETGVFITLGEPTRGMIEEARKSGTYESALTGQEGKPRNVDQLGFDLSTSASKTEPPPAVDGRAGLDSLRRAPTGARGGMPCVSTGALVGTRSPSWQSRHASSRASDTTGS